MKPIFTFVLILFLSDLSAQNKAGTLDLNFGDSGKILTTIPNSSPQPNSSASDSKGNIVVTGTISYPGEIGGFMALKYSVDGLLDTNFGVRGIAVTRGIIYNQAMAIQPDNKIILCGYGYDDPDYFVQIVRFNADGNLDSSFGTDGKIITYQGKFAHAISVQKDSKIVVSANGYGGTILLLRYMPNGTPDESFGNNGVETTSLYASANSNAIQPDGKIVVACDNGNEIILLRFNSDGSPDESFGISGKVFSDLTKTNEGLSKMILQPDGKILIAGTKAGFDNSLLLARYMPDGNLDESFGKKGFTLPDLPFGAYPTSLNLQPDNKLLVAGSTEDDANNYYHTLLIRFNNDGSLDSSFGVNGYQVTEIDESDAAYGIVIQNNGKIILGGGTLNYTGIYGNYGVALSRYYGDDSKKQIIISKIRRWLQHRNGITWDDVPGAKKYIVQRSANGTNWSAVSNINAGSNISHINYYQDATPLNGANYYRLQTTSTDGAVNYSNIITVTNSDIKISPNPAKNILRVEGLSSNKTKITVIDFAGNEKMQVVANKASYNLNISALKPGNYLLKIEMGDEVITKKFVKE